MSIHSIRCPRCNDPRVEAAVGVTTVQYGCLNCMHVWTMVHSSSAISFSFASSESDFILAQNGDDPRPTLECYLMHLAVVASSRGTCDRRKVGCVLTTSTGHVLATGYNGSLPGAPHCSEAGHLLLADRCVRTVHAETNAVASAGKRGTPLDGGLCFTTCRPCPSCAKLLASCGIQEVVYLEPYHGEEDGITAELFEGVMKFTQYDGDRPWAP